MGTDIVYDYDGGKMARDPAVKETELGGSSCGSDGNPTRTLIELLKANPGIGPRQFESIAHQRGVSYNRARRFLKDGIKLDKIRAHSVGKKREHFLSDGYDK